MLIPVILSGGAGTRLWPVSRRTSPKPFIRLPDGESLLAKTLVRALHVADANAPVLTVTGREHYFLTRDEYARVPGSRQRQLPFLLEPYGRNTAPAVLASAMKLQSDHGDDVHMLVLPADHLIHDLDGFADCVAQARVLAGQDHLVTFGLVPDRPETGYGYIRRGPAISGSDGFCIDRFIEKPDAATAQSFLEGGEHYWNSGMFCFPVGALLAIAARVAPDLLAAVQASLPAIADDLYIQTMQEVDVYGTDVPDKAYVDRLNDGTVRVRLESPEQGLYFQRTFDPEETRELRVYLQGDADSTWVGGSAAGPIMVRVIGGGNDDHFEDASTEGSGRTIFYDDREDDNTFVLGADTRVSFEVATAVEDAEAGLRVELGELSF